MSCDRCPKEAAYLRKYSGEALCAGCFSESIMRKAARTISKYGMIGAGSHVCIGVSGGKDSLALLHVLQQMSQTHHFTIEAATVDEGIPGYRQEALEIVEQYCGQLGVKHRVYSYSDLYDMTLDEALVLRGEDKTTSCSICGTLRRRALEKAGMAAKADAVATAHNLDDALQSFVINMMSGDVGRIGWQDPGAGSQGPRRIKPFCEIYEQEIVFYAFANRIPFQTEPCPHMNEGVRTEIREFLNGLESRHAGAKNNLFKSSLKISAALGAGPSKSRLSCSRCGSLCTGQVCSACQILERLGRRRS